MPAALRQCFVSLVLVCKSYIIAHHNNINLQSLILDSTSECAEKAYQKFHKFECNVIDAIQIIFTKIIQISLRTFFEALDVFDGNADELNNFLKEIDGVPRNAYGIEENPDEKAQRKNWLHQTDALVTNEVSFCYNQIISSYN